MPAHVTLEINIDTPVWERLQALAEERRATPRTFIHYAIEEWLHRQGASAREHNLPANKAMERDEMEQERLLITPEEAESLLPTSKHVHNFVGGGGMLIGCDYDRADAIKALRAAKSIEIGGDQCRRMKHPLAVIDETDRVSFFEADMEKVDAFEAERLAS